MASFVYPLKDLSALSLICVGSSKLTLVHIRANVMGMSVLSGFVLRKILNCLETMN